MYTSKQLGTRFPYNDFCLPFIQARIILGLRMGLTNERYDNVLGSLKKETQTIWWRMPPRASCSLKSIIWTIFSTVLGYFT